jgi:hypothetical protein
VRDELSAVARVVLERPERPDGRAALREGVRALVAAGAWSLAAEERRFRSRRLTLSRGASAVPPGLAALHAALGEVAGPAASIELSRAARGLARHERAVLEAALAELEAAGLVAPEERRRLLRRTRHRRTPAGDAEVRRAPRRDDAAGTDGSFGDGEFDRAFDGGFDAGGDGGGGGD